MQQLYFTYAETRRLHGSQTHNWPSRFLQEVPAGCLQEVRMGGDVSRQFRSLHNGTDAEEDEPEGGVRIGQFVTHAAFGEGVVLQSEGHGDRTRVQVNFARGRPEVADAGVRESDDRGGLDCAPGPLRETTRRSTVRPRYSTVLAAALLVTACSNEVQVSCRRVRLDRVARYRVRVGSSSPPGRRTCPRSARHRNA